MDWRGPFSGLSLGVAGKLRLPLPATADDALAALVENASVWKTDLFAILDTPGLTRAVFGARRPLAGIVLLDRQDTETTPVLSALSQAQAVRALLEQHFAPHLSTGQLLAACTAIAGQVPAWRFRYSGCSEAAAHLRNALADAAAA